MSILQSHQTLTPAVSLDEIKAYLLFKGWQETPYRNPRLLVYQGEKDDEGNPIEVVLTQNESYTDTPRRIAEVITTLAELEDRSAEDVAQEVASVDDDVVLWKISEPDHQQSISLELAASFVSGLQHLLTYSACLEETPQPYFARATGIGREFVQHCRFGHTRPGSFVFEMESPLSFQSGKAPSNSQGAPFPRRVMQRLMRGLSEVSRVAVSGDSDALVQSYQDGFNANAYQTLSQMLENVGEQGLEFDFRWSPVVRPSVAWNETGFRRLDRGAVVSLKDAARRLREMKPQSGVRLRGRIFRLGADTDGTPRVITLETTVKGVDRHVRMSLGAADYVLACDAHRDNKAVQVTGTLEKSGRTWRLLDAHGFSLA